MIRSDVIHVVYISDMIFEGTANSPLHIFMQRAELLLRIRRGLKCYVKLFFGKLTEFFEKYIPASFQIGNVIRISIFTLQRRFHVTVAKLNLVEPNRHFFFVFVLAELLKKVGIGENLLDKYPNQLSGGECQRVGIVRAVINDPKILFADECSGTYRDRLYGCVCGRYQCRRMR